MSYYRKLLEALEALKCPDCGGLGKCNDADPGDISFKEWTCVRCNGDGIVSNEAKVEADPSVKDGKEHS